MQSEYYILRRENNDSYPLLRSTTNADYEFDDNFIEDANIIEYTLGRPIPKKPIMVDYHKTPYSVISDKIANEIKGVYGVQLISAIITGKDKELYENYFYLHIHNHLPVLDREKSVYTWIERRQRANPIEKLYLNNDLLSAIPLEKRLVFRLKENSTFEIFHKSIVDKIIATEPKGLLFVNVEDWHI